MTPGPAATPGVAGRALARFEAAFAREPAPQHAAFEQALRERGLAIPTFPRPLLVSAAERDALVAATTQLHRAVEAITRERVRGRFADALPAGAPAGRIPARRAGREPVLGFTRYDVVLDRPSGRLQFLEVNAGDPSGMGYADAVMESLEFVSAYTALREGFDLEIEPLLGSVDRALCGRLPADADQRLVIAVASDSTVRDDHKINARLLRGRGWEVALVDPRALTYDGAALRAPGDLRPIALVLRDTVDELVLEPYWPHTTALLDADRDGAVELVNPLSAILADAKAMFALLTDPAVDVPIPDPAREQLRPVLPWTRLVRPGPTTGPAGEPIPELGAFVLANRERLVLKPNEGWGGFGVVVGPATTSTAWTEAAQCASANPGRFVVQAFAGFPEERWPIFTGGRFAGFEPRKVNTSVWVHDGAVAGLFARASRDAVINVHQGGGLVPVAVVRDRPASGS